MTFPSFDPGFSTPEMTEVFGPAAAVAAMCEFESALAMALVDSGLAPEDEGVAAATAFLDPVDDPDSILASSWVDGTPVIALVEGVRERLGSTAAQWAHFGATSQDAIDTGRMLQARAGLRILEAGLFNIANLTRDLTVEHRNTPHMGRTFLQDSRPTTFGARTAGWLAPTVESLSDLRTCREDLPVQLGGPSGMLSDYGDKAVQVVDAVSRRLELRAPAISWHTDRTPVWRLARTVETVALVMGKIATDIALLAQSGVEEVSVRQGRSSSMAGKRNPIDAVRAVAAASACNGFVSMVTGARFHELDRGVGGWHIEWLALPMVFHTAGAAVEAVATCLESIEVDVERMALKVDQLPDVDAGLLDAVLDRFAEVVE